MNCKVRVLLAMAIVAALSVAAPAQSIPTGVVSEIPTVAFCEVIQNPQRYDGKLIRIRVVWLGNFEWNWLYAADSDGCESHKNFIRPFLDCPDDDACKPLQNALNANLRGDPFDGAKGRFLVTGHFHYRKEPLRNGEGQNGACYYKLGVTNIDALKRARHPSRKR